MNNNKQHASVLSKIVTPTIFKQAYEAFIEQADINKTTKKANGSKIPKGFSTMTKYKDHRIKCEYGRGTPSSRPYMNWCVVSIYYEPDIGNITVGIEETRYDKLNQMNIKPLYSTRIGKNQERVAVFYSTNKSKVNYDELYDKWMDVCEEVIRLW